MSDLDPQAKADMVGREVARRATEPSRELTVALSKAALYAKTLFKLRNTLLQVNDHIEDEVDRVYFGSSNDADALREIARQIDDLQWEVILADSQPPEDLYAIIAEQRARADRAEADLGAVRQATIEALHYIREHLVMDPESGEAIDVLAGTNDIGARIGTVLTTLRSAS